MNYRELINSKYIGQWDFDDGQKLKVTIERAEIEEVHNTENNKKERKLILYFAKAKKGLVLNGTNGKRLQHAFGSKNTDAWLGKQITLYVGEGTRKKRGVRVETNLDAEIKAWG